MKRTLLHTSLLALLACYSVSMGASATRTEEGESFKLIRTIRVLPLLDKEAVVRGLLNTATKDKILRTAAAKYEDEEVTIAMRQDFMDGIRTITDEDIAMHGTTIIPGSVLLNIELPGNSIREVGQLGGTFRLDQPIVPSIPTATSPTEYPFFNVSSHRHSITQNGGIKAILQVFCSFNDGETKKYEYYVNGNLFYPNRNIANTVAGIPFADEITSDRLDLVLVKANALFLAGRNPQAQANAGSTSSSGESSSVTTSSVSISADAGSTSSSGESSSVTTSSVSISQE